MASLSGYLRTVYVPSRLDLKPHSAQQLCAAVNRLDQWAGREVLLSELSPELVNAFLAWLGSQSAAPRTVNNKRQQILCVWSHAARSGIVPPFNESLIARRKLPKRAPTAWTSEEMASIIQHLRRPWLKVLATFIYETGTRFTSASLLTWSDWNSSTRLMRLPAETSKTNTEQYVKVSEKTAEEIERLRRLNSDRIFPCPNDRRPIWAELKAACKAAGLPHTRRDLFQKIRRTCATLTAAHAGIDAAARQLGHTSTAMTIAHYIDPRMLPQIHASDVLPPL